MGTELPKKLAIMRSALTTIKTIPQLLIWLKQFIRELDSYLLKIYNQMEFGGSSFSNWDIREVTAADVAAGNGKTVGNLLFIHKVSGRKFELEQS